MYLLDEDLHKIQTERDVPCPAAVLPNLLHVHTKTRIQLQKTTRRF